MSRHGTYIWYVALMVALIVTVDVVWLRHHFWARAATNAGIVLVFLGLFWLFKGSGR